MSGQNITCDNFFYQLKSWEKATVGNPHCGVNNLQK